MPERSNLYYNSIKSIALQMRDKYELTSPRLLPGKLKQIIKAEGVDKVVLWSDFKRVRGAYMIEPDGQTIIVVRKGLPNDPYVFTLAHELKHHLCDREFGNILCSISNESAAIEIAAEIFAAQFIYPEQMYLSDLGSMGIHRGGCTPEDIVRLKRETQTTLSYTALAKRAMFMKLAPQHSLNNVPWKKLEEKMFGKPFYLRFRRAANQ